MATNMSSEEVLHAFQQLSPEHQEEVADLIQELLVEQGEDREEKQQPKQQRNWRAAAGMLLRPGQTPPTDEEVEQIIREARMKKYGE